MQGLTEDRGRVVVRPDKRCRLAAPLPERPTARVFGQFVQEEEISFHRNVDPRREALIARIVDRAMPPTGILQKREGRQVAREGGEKFARAVILRTSPLSVR